MGVETRKRLVWACTMRPSPCRFRFIRLYRALRMGADDAPPAADRHACGVSPGSALKKRAFGSAGRPKISLSARKAAVRRGFAVFCTRSPLYSFPRGIPPAPGAASLLRPAGTVSASAVYGRTPDRRRRAPAAQGTRCPNEAPRACPPSGKRCALYGSTHL